MAFHQNPRIRSVSTILTLYLQIVYGSWGHWGEWSEGPCSVTCGSGELVISRSRICADVNNKCLGARVDKKVVSCEQGHGCGDLECYECNVFRYGKTIPCEKPSLLTNCRACLRTYTKIRLHDRQGYSKDSEVESRLCVRQRESNIWSKEKCVYHTNNGGYTVMCQCFSDKCNSGVRQGALLSPSLFAGFVLLVSHLIKL